MQSRTNAHHLAKSDLAVVEFLIAAPNPLGKVDLSRQCPPASVKRLFEGGHLHEAISSEGGACVVVAPLTLKELSGRPPWHPHHDTILRRAWRAGEAVLAIAGQLDRAGGEVLSRAWALGLARQADQIHRFEVNPAWKVRRLRQALVEAERRGIDLADRGAEIEHRALRLRYELGRKLIDGMERRPVSHWIERERISLRALIAEGRSIKFIAYLMGRNPRDTALQIAIEGRRLDKTWQEQEDNIIIEGARYGLGFDAIARMLPGRSVGAIHWRLRILCPGYLPLGGGMPWSPGELQKLVDGFEKRLRGKALYGQFNRHGHQAARRKLYNLKFEHDKNAKMNVTQMQQIVGAALRGDSAEDVARILMWDVERVRPILEHAKVRNPGRARKLTKAQLLEIKRLRAQTPPVPVPEISERYNVSQSTLFRWLREPQSHDAGVGQRVG